MFIRFVTFKAMPDKQEELRKFFNDEVYPVLQRTPGCLYAVLVENTSEPEEFSSLTLWESADAIKAYMDSGKPASFTEKARSLFLAEPEAWQLQLTEDLVLESKPVVPDPQESAYRIFAVMNAETLGHCRAAGLHLRLMRLRASANGLEGFKQHYIETAIPALREVRGCRNAFLIGNLEAQRHLISVTVWDSAADAEAYDRGPIFQSLLSNTRDLISAHVWQSTLQTDLASKVYTSDNIKVETYSGVTGQNFQAG